MKAAEQGHPGAQNNLGVMYDAGIGVVKNKSRAHMFFYMASVKNERLAVRNLAMIRGEMTEQEIAIAKEYADQWMEEYP